MCFITLALIDRAMGRPPVKPPHSSRKHSKRRQQPTPTRKHKQRYSPESDHSERNRHNVENIEIDEEDEHEW